MNPRTELAFDCLIKNLAKDPTLYKSCVPYCVSDSKRRITVFGLQCVSNNHDIDDNPELWGVTKEEAHRIRAYFHNEPVITQIIGLYTKYPTTFQGESRLLLKQHVPDLERLAIQLFD